MLTEELLNAESCWALLERVAASKQLRHAVRLKEILFYVGKRSLKDGCARVHEQEIGFNVFRRSASYDTAVDNIVRTNVSELRKRIEAYFNSEGSHELLVMEIPRGSYIPVFRARNTEPEPVEERFNEIQLPAVELAVETPKAGAHPGWMPAALIGVGLLILVMGAACFYFWSQYRALHRSLFAWQDKPTVAEFWSQILNSNPNTDVVISDTGIGMVGALSKKTFPLNDYLNRSYISQLQDGNMSPDMHTAINRILAWNLASPDEFMLARRILALDPAGKYLHLYNARNYVPDLVTRDNVILIGARKSNPWDELFDNRINFITEFDSPRVINRAPVAGEQAVYLPSNADGYCVVAYLRNSDHSGQVLLIEGTNAEATEAAGNFLLSEEQLSGFKKMLHVSTLPDFQVLLKVSSVRGTPLAATVAAYRVSSESTKTAK
ncbi:MAG TPA: hypothetical protein VGT08_05175 [Terracidiphilus sp.]|nr:hypothetical protein [Terracidiphilus sp.]